MIKKGLIAGVALFVVGMALNYGAMFAFPSLAAEYQNTNLFRPWDDPLMISFFAYPFILGVVLAFLWSLVKDKIKGTYIEKALKFAKLYFVIATIPGMFVSFTSFQLSLPMVLVWTVTGFVNAFVAGYIFSRTK